MLQDLTLGWNVLFYSFNEKTPILHTWEKLLWKTGLLKCINLICT